MSGPAPAAVAAVPTLREMVRGAARLLAEAGVPSAEHDAAELAAHLLGVRRGDLVLAPPLPEGFAHAYAALVERRRLREPLQHILGTAAFRHLELAVGPGVFVPRPETEQVAQVAVDAARACVARTGAAVVVDLCTGSAAIALAVATEVAGARVHAVEADPAAHAWAARNVSAVTAARAAGAARPGDPVVHLVLGDATDPAVLAGLDAAVDVVVSNPPYIPPDAVPQDPEVRDHDPDRALYGGGPDGLEVPRGVLATAVRLLRPGGLLVMEHAEVQAAAVRDAATATGLLLDVRTLTDLSGRDRMVVARRAPGPGPRVAQPDVGDSRP